MNKRKLFTLALALCVVAILAIGGTLAYFTDTDEVDNVFTMGNVDISLDEAPVDKVEDEWFPDDEADRVKENIYEDVYPGAVLPKDPTVHNDGSYDAYIRVKVTIDFNKLSAMQADKILFNGAKPDEDLTNIVDIDTENWTYMGREIDMSGDNRNVTYIYNYNEILASGADARLFTEVTIPSFVTNEDVAGYGLDEFNLDVIAEAIQTVGFENAAEAWAAYGAE